MNDHEPRSVRGLLLAALLLPFCVSASAVPPGFNVQGRLTDSNGVNRNGTYSIKLGMWDQQAASPGVGGSLLWKRTYPAVAVINGNFQVLVADPADADSPLSSLPAAFAGDSRFLEFTVVAGPGIVPGGEPAMVPRQQLVSVPYSLRSSTADYSSYAAVAGAVTTPSVPTGTVLPFSASTPPDGFLECNGAAVSRTTYVALFAAIGTSFGSGDGATTFNLPDLRGVFIRGWSHGSGKDPDAASRTSVSGGAAGDSVGSFQGDRTRGHYHIEGAFTSGPLSGGEGAYYPYSQNPNTSNVMDSPIAGNMESRPKNVNLMYIIKN